MNKRLRKKKNDSTVGTSRRQLKEACKAKDVQIKYGERQIVKLNSNVADLKIAHYREMLKKDKDIKKLRENNQLINGSLQEMISYNDELIHENRTLTDTINNLKKRNLFERILNKGVE